MTREAMEQALPSPSYTNEAGTRKRASEMLHNQRGQRLGTKGNRTRRSILDATRDMIFERPFREISGVDIAKQANVSVATLYTYFEDVTAVVIALAEEVAEQAPDVSSLMRVNWQDASALGYIVQTINTLLEYNMQFYPIIRLRNYLADEGNEQLATIRSRTAKPIIAMLARQIVTRGRMDDADVPALVQKNAVCTAGLLYGMIDRLTLLLMQSPYPERSLNKEEYIDATAHILFASVTAAMPDEPN